MCGFSQKGFAGIPVLILLFVGLFVGVYLVQNRTNFLPKAFEDNPEYYADNSSEMARTNFQEEPSFDELLAREESLNNTQAQDFETSGVLTVVHGDDFENKKSSTAFFLEDFTDDSAKINEKFLRLYFAKNPPFGLKSGIRISVKGRLINNKLFISSGDINSSDSAISPLIDGGIREAIVAPSEGSSNKVAVIFIMFNNSTRTFTPEAYKEVITTGNGAVGKFFSEISYGKLDYPPSNFEFFTNNNEWYLIHEKEPTDGGFMLECYDAMKRASMEVESRIGNERLRSFRHRVFVFPKLRGCFYGGLGEMSGENFLRVWILNGVMDSNTLLHEMSHNFGLGHAGFYRCRDKLNIAAVGECELYDYMDYFDVVGLYLTLSGDKRTNHHYNAPHKYAAGWIKPGAGLVEHARGTAEYELYPIELKGASSDEIKSVMIKRNENGGKSEYYFLEYRQPVGFDATIAQVAGARSPNSVINGLSIRLWDKNPEEKMDINKTKLLQIRDSGFKEYFEPALCLSNDPGCTVKFFEDKTYTNNIRVEVLEKGTKNNIPFLKVRVSN